MGHHHTSSLCAHTQNQAHVDRFGSIDRSGVAVSVPCLVSSGSVVGFFFWRHFLHAMGLFGFCVVQAQLLLYTPALFIYTRPPSFYDLHTATPPFNLSPPFLHHSPPVRRRKSP